MTPPLVVCVPAIVDVQPTLRSSQSLDSNGDTHFPAFLQVVMHFILSQAVSSIRFVAPPLPAAIAAQPGLLFLLPFPSSFRVKNLLTSKSNQRHPWAQRQTPLRFRSASKGNRSCHFPKSINHRKPTSRSNSGFATGVKSLGQESSSVLLEEAKSAFRFVVWFDFFSCLFVFSKTEGSEGVWLARPWKEDTWSEDLTGTSVLYTCLCDRY